MPITLRSGLPSTRNLNRLPRPPSPRLALPHLHNGDTCTRLAAAWRKIQEEIILLSAAAGDLKDAMQHIWALAYATLDGALMSIDRAADPIPHYSGRRKRHGANVQVVADVAGRLAWASAALLTRRTTRPPPAPTVLQTPEPTLA
ncbi:hypothetical protein Acy02nite_91380 [Actinoplanes cyaneus]|uniref:Transposase n=1 Tax=Actinoplanes cyaneus TaxID=52696 RepID=A0A919M9W0_9ACTN|nr:hypothetical protein Acy02nite_91380 [Actinoplanes cyaneus]